MRITVTKDGKETMTQTTNDARETAKARASLAQSLVQNFDVGTHVVTVVVTQEDLDAVADLARTARARVTETKK